MAFLASSYDYIQWLNDDLYDIDNANFNFGNFKIVKIFPIINPSEQKYL